MRDRKATILVGTNRNDVAGNRVREPVLKAYQSSGSDKYIFGVGEYTNLTISRFPSSSELVVTPETQNVWGSAFWTGVKNFTTASTTLAAFSDPVFAVNRTFYGKAESLTNPNDIGLKIPQMPAGNYKIQLSARRIGTQNSHAGTVDFACAFSLQDGTNNWIINTNDYGPLYTANSTHTGTFVVSYNTVADREYKLYYAAGYARNTVCSMFEPRITITPLDNASNSALYVQGPVRAPSTGNAIATGYVGEEITGTSTSGTGDECASISLTPGQWMLYGMGWGNITGYSTLGSFDIEIDDTSSSLSGLTGSFTRTTVNANGPYLLSTFRIVRVSTTSTRYLNCRLVGTGTKTNAASVFKAVRLN